MTETRLNYDQTISAETPMLAASRAETRFAADYGDTPLELVTLNVIKLAPGKWKVKIRAENNPDYPQAE